MSTIGYGIVLSPLLKDDMGQSDLNSLALWILKICYDQFDPSPIEILRVKEELKKIYNYEGTNF